MIEFLSIDYQRNLIRLCRFPRTMSQNHENLPGHAILDYQTVDSLIESYLIDLHSLDDFFIYNLDNQPTQFSAETNRQDYAIESSANRSFSSNGSSLTHHDSLSETNNSTRNTRLLADKFPAHPVLSRQASEIIRCKNLKEMLIASAKALAFDDLSTFDRLMSELRQLVSVRGDPLQRLGAYMLEGLVARLAFSGSSIYKSLKCKEPKGSNLLSYMHLLYEACPYFKFGYLSANGAIAEAMRDKTDIHIIDFQISQGAQWVALIQALAASPGGPPRVRITGIDDPVSAHARGGGLEIVGRRLLGLAKSCGLPFEFRGLAIPSCEIQAGHLEVRPGEALAVNFALMLHHTPDESVGPGQNHRDRILKMVRTLSPGVVTLVEQESDTSAAPFVARFVETLDYYLAVFESVDVALPREHKERVYVEQHCLARDIVNLIACEGLERVERHEVLEKWRVRFCRAGFRQLPSSPFVNGTIKGLLESYEGDYTLRESDGCLFLGWRNRDLVASCAWV